MRAVNRYYSEDTAGFTTLLKVSMNEALGLGGGAEKIDLLTRRIEALNRKMMDLVNEAVESGEGMEAKDAEFKEISDEIEQLNGQIQAIQAALEADKNAEERLREISEQIEKIRDGIAVYDDTVIRQSVECVKIYKDCSVDVIFGGGFTLSEHVKPYQGKRGRKKKEAE